MKTIEELIDAFGLRAAEMHEAQLFQEDNGEAKDAFYTARQSLIDAVKDTSLERLAVEQGIKCADVNKIVGSIPDMPMYNDGWILVGEALPPVGEHVLLQDIDGYMFEAWLRPGGQWNILKVDADNEVIMGMSYAIAWRPRPRPYQPKGGKK